MSQNINKPETSDADKLIALRMSINPSRFRLKLVCSELALRLQANLPLFYAPGHFVNG